MAERDRQNPTWNERQQWHERDRQNLNLDDRQRFEDRERSWGRGEAQGVQDRSESRWRQESGYGSQDFGERQYGGQSGQPAGYGGYSSQRDYGGRAYSSERDYGGGQHSGSRRFEGVYGSGRDFAGGQQQGSYGGQQQGSYGGQQSDYGRYGSQGDYRGHQASSYTQTGYGGASQGWQSGYGAGQQHGRIQRRGPKNYKRSDERIREDICERLMQSDVDASEVVVQVTEAKVTLEGSVPERRMKYVIEDIVDQSFGVTDVDNNLRVLRPGGESAWTGASRSSAADGLNRCLRSELSAIETYRQALDRDRSQYGTQSEFQRLSAILGEHEDAASRLRQAIQQEGGAPSTDSGAWGTWSKIVMGAAKLFGDKASLKALKEGEESGFKEYERAQRESDLPRQLIDLTSELMGRQQRHIRELDSLIAAADRR